VSATSLQTVIRVKQFQVKKAQRELSEIKVSREKEQGALDHLEEKKDSAMNDSVRIMRTSAGDLQTSRAFIQSLSRQIQRQEDRIDEIKKQEDDKREELIEKKKVQEMVKNLDVKRKEVAEKEKEKKAQKVIDMLAQRLKLGFQ